jgi:RimJ/RimL family protein N-acetyltransferase
MGRENVISLIRPDNLASVRVAERLGEKIKGRTVVLGHEAAATFVALPS